MGLISLLFQFKLLGGYQIYLDDSVFNRNPNASHDS